MAVAIVATVVTLLTAAGVIAAFVWAARKDGEEDRELHERLGIERETRIGR